ncbi:MAG: alkaline phosphatase [Clostridia bacterium]|nr:alkaline phosphatase [Clostridia bacterium]
MKKILSFILCIALMLCMLASCSSVESPSEDTSSDQASHDESTSYEESSTQDEESSQEPEKQHEYIDISKYTVVIPTECDASTKYAAENLVRLVDDVMDIELSIVTDDIPETELELLVGETNREESKTDTSLAEKQYLLFMENGKIVMKGFGIYIGAACGDFINRYTLVSKNGLDVCNVPKAETALTFEFESEYRNVILMIGDGMGPVHITMAEMNGLDSFVARGFSSIGESVTRSQSVINGDEEYTDSAASGTAMSTGYKTLNKYIGLDKDGNAKRNVRELAYISGAKTAVITTDVITGATPSSFLCHHNSREDTEILQAKINEVIASQTIDYIAGDVGDEFINHTKTALNEISSDGSRFFIMLEEGMIDKASHSKDKNGVIEYVTRFDDVIAYATQFTLCHPDTALIVTADHETGALEQAKKLPKYFYFNSWEHTNADVPLFALGAGTEIFNGVKTENINIGKFCAAAYTSEPFGQQTPVE